MASCGGGSKKNTETTNQVQQQTLDPRMQALLYGNTNAQGGTTGGLFGDAQQLYAAGSANGGLNSAQSGAITGAQDYLNSPGAMAGYNALNGVGTSLMNQQMPDYLKNLLGQSAPQISGISSVSPAQAQASQAQAAQAEFTKADPARTAAAGAVNYQSSINPYLNSMLSDIRGNTINDFNRSVAPMARSNAQLAGGFGGSRQGVVEANAMNDLGRNISTAQTGLLGQITESDANRRLSAEQTNASLATQAALANAAAANNMSQFNAAGANNMSQFNTGALNSNSQFNAGLGQQANLANAGYAQQAGLYNAGAANDMASQNAQLQAQRQGLDLQAGGLLSGRDIANQQAAAQGAGLLQTASQIPLQNYQNQFDLGSMLANAPWDQLKNYASILYPGAEWGDTNSLNRRTDGKSYELGFKLGG